MTARTILFLTIASTWALLHILALQIELYWYFWWFDIPMHFFGGAVVALGLFTLIDLGVRLPLRSQRFFSALGFVFLVALLWEGYELLIVIPIESDFWLDTTLDLLMGLLGGAAGWFLAVTFSAFNKS